jgi:hypothetical protein
MTEPTKTKVTEQALIARINRKLAKENGKLKRCRENSKDFNTLGYFYTIDLSLNCIVDRHIELAEYAQELGVMAGFEELAE